MAEVLCKYYKLIRQVSYNSGQTWSNVDPPEYRQGDLYESGSIDCGVVPLYRWVTGTTCVDFDKYLNMIEQVSYDDGSTWESTGVESASTLIERDSFDCTKLYVTYGDGSIERLKCGTGDADIGISKLTRGETTQVLCCFSDMASVIIGNCVDMIHFRAFEGCTTLTSVTIPDSVTEIDAYAFKDCSGLTNVTIPSNVGYNAFERCTSLTSCTINNGYIADSSFIYCENLTNVTLGSGVTYIGAMAFFYCHNLSHINIPNSVTRIEGSAFYHCCGGLTSIEIPDSVTSIGSNAFNMCCILTSVTIGSGIETIGDDAFSNCPHLSSVTINATTPPDLLGDRDIFHNDWVLDFIYVPSGSVETYKTAWPEYADIILAQGTTPTPTGDIKWVTYGNGRMKWRECDSTSAITEEEIDGLSWANFEIGECVTSIGVSAFEGCTSLINISIPNNVTTIGIEAFRDCTSLSSITIPNSVTNINNRVFYGCRGLVSVTIPNSVTSIGDSAFDGCSGLTSVTIPSGVTDIEEGCFFSCSSLTSITVNATTPPSLGAFAFYGSSCPIYVPSMSVDAYKAAYHWSDYASRIQAIP